MIFDRGGGKLAQEPAEEPDLVGVGCVSSSFELEWEEGIVNFLSRTRTCNSNSYFLSRTRTLNSN